MNTSKQALVLVDIQQGVVPPAALNIKRSTPNLELNVSRLLGAFRSTPGACVFHVHHHSKHEASSLHPTKQTVAARNCATALPSELIITKSGSSGFAGTNLGELIKRNDIDRVVFCGTTTNHCVSSTVRMAADLNVVDHAYGVSGIENPKPGRIVIVSDATAMYDIEWLGKKYDVETAHEITLATLQDEFCDVESTAEVIAKLKHP